MDAAIGRRVDSGSVKGAKFSEHELLCEPAKLGVFSKSSCTADSVDILASVVPSMPAPVSDPSPLTDTAEGRRNANGLRVEEVLAAGGGIEMLALPTAPVVPTSANRLFLLVTEAVGDVRSKEWEEVRDHCTGMGGLVDSAFTSGRLDEEEDAETWLLLLSLAGEDWEGRDEALLSRLVVLGEDDILFHFRQL